MARKYEIDLENKSISFETKPYKINEKISSCEILIPFKAIKELNLTKETYLMVTITIKK